jgi:hypothetical protein
VRTLLSRRAALKGMGTAIALPWLEAMSPVSIWANAGPSPPIRMAVMYAPNGKYMPRWTPAEAGALPGQLPFILQPLASLRRDVSVISGLASAMAAPTTHSPYMAAFLTGARLHNTRGDDLRLGISADQIAAARLAGQTRLSSLELGTMNSGGDADGNNSEYFNLSWRDATTPMRPILQPRVLFDRLFASPLGGGNRRGNTERRSILDFVLAEANSLRDDLGSSDRRKLDEYLASIRDIEQRIERVARLPLPARPNLTIPDQNWSNNWEEHVRIMVDLMVLAFQTDSTRICTFALRPELNSGNHPNLGFSEHHHDLSHHQRAKDFPDKYATVGQFHVAQFAYLLRRLKESREGDGTLLDHCVAVYGAGMSDGNGHDPRNLPIVLAGRGGGTFNPGRHIRLNRETPLCNLWLSVLECIGTPIDRLGDSTGRLSGL